MENNSFAKNSRVEGLDLIRSCAILFVIAGHFFMNTEFKTAVFQGSSLFIQGTVQFFFWTSVPLFIMMTGYFNWQKECSARYYKGGLHVLGSYLLFSILTILFRKYYLGDTSSWFQWVQQIFSFSAIPYGWYIEMWIGLFLLIPFLNILYRNIPTRRQKLLLIVTLYIMTALPHGMNRAGMHFIPGFWVSCYPLMFYFAGAYIREYQPEIKTIWGGIILIIALCLINPVFNTLFIEGRAMVTVAGGPQGAFCAILTILFFLMCYRRKISSVFKKRILESISRASLDMYLCCYIFDALLYPVFKKRYFIDQAQFGGYFFVIVPLLFAGAFALAWLKEKTIVGIVKMMKKRTLTE